MFKKCFMCRIEALGVTCTGRYAECFYSVLLQTHRKPSQGNPPEIFSGKPTGNFLRKPTGNLPRETHRKSSQGNPPEIFSGNPPEIFSGNPPEIFSGNPPEIFSGKPHRKSCQRPTLNQIKSGGITVNLPEILSDQIKSGGITVNPPEILSDRPALNQSKFCGGITVKSPEIQLAEYYLIKVNEVYSVILSKYMRSGG